MSVKIKAYRLENFKRIREIQFEPEECGLFVIGGKNREGKTSSLDGIPWLLGGAKFAPSNAKNNDAVGNVYGRITLSNGIVVERGGKNGTLKVTDPDGGKAGQELLNKFISALALDLPKFLHASDKEKALILLDTLGIRDKLDELDRQEKLLYDERTEIGRVALALRKHADEMPYYHDAPNAELSAAEIIARQQDAVAKNNDHARIRQNAEKLREIVTAHRREVLEYSDQTDAKQAQLKLLERENGELAKKIEQLESKEIDDGFGNELDELILRAKQRRYDLAGYCNLNGVVEALEHAKVNWEYALKENLARLTGLRTKRDETRTKNIEPLKEEIRIRHEKMSGAEEKLAEKEKMLREYEASAAALPPDIDLGIFKADIEKMEAENAKFRANVAHDKAAAEATEQESEYDRFTKRIEDVRRERMQLLASVRMPLAGLTVKDSLLYYNGQKWDCMSGSEKMIVATSIVRAVNPECGFVLMDQLEAMDLDTLDDFDRWLKEQNLQVIATRVSSGDECAIIIEDGMIRRDN